METHMIFETHAHYDDEAFEQDREALLNSMEAHGIGHIVNACASIESQSDRRTDGKISLCLWRLWNSPG